jgi:hypothetical protein
MSISEYRERILGLQKEFQLLKQHIPNDTGRRDEALCMIALYGIQEWGYWVDERQQREEAGEDPYLPDLKEETQ